MYEQLVKSLIAPIAAIITAAFFSEYKPDGISKLQSVILGTLIYYLLALSYDMVFNRKKLKYTGKWIGLIEKNNNLYLAFFTIKFSWFTTKYSLNGVAYCENGVFHSSWHSNWINYVADQDQINYAYESKIYKQTGIVGFGNLSFTIVGGSGKPLHGNGYFVDMGVDPLRCEYFFYKYDECLAKSLVGSAELNTPEAISKFIKVYKKNYPDRIKQCYVDEPEYSTTSRQPKNKHPLLSIVSRPSRHSITSSFVEINHLKNIYRQGWLNNDIPERRCESVADHSYVVALYTLFYGKLHKYTDEKLCRMLAMALLHDLGEIYAGDTVPGEISKDEKYIREHHGLSRIVSKFDKNSADWLLEVWDEFYSQEKPEAKLVRAFDLLDMQVQAYIYELNDLGDLSEFFTHVMDISTKDDGTSDIAAIFEEINTLRNELRGQKKQWRVID